MSFTFENLSVYKLALEWAELSEQILKRTDKNLSRHFADQFGRASLSIPLNIAEGNGRWHKPDKRNFFWIARGSAFECVPLIELMKRQKIITDAEASQLRERLIVIGKMLTNLVKVHE